jgi:hypothetical protein
LRDLLSQFTFWATIRLSEVMLNDPRHFQLPFGAVLEAKAINLYFADSKSSGSNYDKIPDAVGLLHVPYWLRDLLSQFTFWATIRLSEVMLNDPRHFVLEAKAINLYFADSKSSGSNYDKIPDAVGLQPMAYWLRDLLSQFTFWATIRLSEVMLNDPRHFQLPNLKVPWVIQHDLGKADRRPERELRQKIAQPVRDMHRGSYRSYFPSFWSRQSIG